MDERDGDSAGRGGPVVSVIVPTCDRPGTLLPCLRSILDQQPTTPPIEMEVLVIDDGRPGSARSVVDQLRDDRITVIPCTGGNAAAARNLGVEAARGEWLAFCDDDDLWAPDKLVSQIEALEGSGAGWACTGAIVVDRDLRVIGHQRLTDEGMERLDEISVVPGGGSTVIARTDLVREVGRFDDQLTNAEDWDLWLRLRDRSEPVVVDRPLVAYRRWGASKSTDTSMLKRSLDTIVRRGSGPRRSHVRERYIADQWLRSGRRIRAARAYADLAIVHHRPPDAARAVAALVSPAALSRHDHRKALAVTPPTWCAEVETWLAPLRTVTVTPAAPPEVTVVVVPRERFSVALRSLESIYAHTDVAFELVYVDGGSPPAVRDELRVEAQRRGFRLLRSEEYLWPNRARNLGLSVVDTPYVVFVDNDVIVTPAWLRNLVQCAEETGAWVVGPMIMEGDPADGMVHNAGGFWRFDESAHGRDLVQDNRFGHRHVSELPAGLPRHRVDYVEFHCCLVRTSALDVVGPLDERLMSTREHLDLCLAVEAAGGEVWTETAARVTYDDPPPVRIDDAAFFSLRWSEAWNGRSLRHFVQKHGLDPRYVGRAAKSNARRQVLFRPISEWSGRWVGPRAERLVVAVLTRLERRVNVVLVRRLERRSAILPISAPIAAPTRSQHPGFATVAP